MRTNHKKLMVQLRFKDEILKMKADGKSINEITKAINKRAIQTKLKVTLSASTIRNLIKKYEKKD